MKKQVIIPCLLILTHCADANKDAIVSSHAIKLKTTAHDNIPSSSSISQNKTQTLENDNSQKTFYIHQKAQGKTYYLLEENYTCLSANKKKITSFYKNSIEFTSNKVIIHGDVCSDSIHVIPLESFTGVFSNDLRSLIFNGETYVLHE